MANSIQLSLESESQCVLNSSHVIIRHTSSMFIAIELIAAGGDEEEEAEEGGKKEKEEKEDEDQRNSYRL